MDEDGAWYRAVCIEWQTIDNGNDSAGCQTRNACPAVPGQLP